MRLWCRKALTRDLTIAGRSLHIVYMQAPALHVVPIGQMVSQAPQFDALVCRFTHEVPHCVRLAGQGSTQLEPMQS